MTPLSFNFGGSDAIAVAQRRLSLLVDDAAGALGLNVAASVCGCTPAQLRDAIDGRNNRRLPTEWVIAIARQVGGDYRDRIMELLQAAIDPGQPATDAQFIEALMDGMRRFGEHGEDELKAIRRRCKR